MDEARIKAATRAASQRFKDEFSVVALPNLSLPYIEKHLNEAGYGFEVVDDGEDDGVPVLIAVLKSAAMDVGIAWHRRQYRYWTAVFAVCAAGMGVGIVLDSSYLIVITAFLGTTAGLNVVSSHKRWEMRSRARAVLVSKGL